MSPYEPRRFEELHIEDFNDIRRNYDVEKAGHWPREQGISAYPINETEMLVVGGSRADGWKFWLMNKFRGARQCKTAKERKCYNFARVFSFLVIAWLLLSVGHFAIMGYKLHGAIRSLKCAPITPSKHAHGIAVTIPLKSHAHLLVHDTLTGGDSSITHDKTVANDTVQLTVTFANDTKLDAIYDGCIARFRHSVAVGLIPRDDNGMRAKISTFTIHIPPSFKAPSVKFLGQADRSISDRKLQKFIRWWRKHRGRKYKEPERRIF